MAYLYILRNYKNKYYIGITAKEPKDRLARHNSGDVISTRSGKPWSLIFTEKFNYLSEARVKEKLIKSWHGGNAFKRFLRRTAGSSNGRTHPSGGWYLGSNPGPAVLRGNNKSGGVK